MTFLAPWFLVAGAVGGLLLVALHLIARQRPRTAPLPTARFVPERQVRAPSRSVWPTDLALMALRLTIVALVAGAFARPQWKERRDGTARVVLADQSRAVASIVEVSDSARRLVRAGAKDVAIPFDSGSNAPGSLSAALVAGIRSARQLARGADSVELVVISPFAEEEWDAATDSIRALWPGRIRLVRVAAAASTARTNVARLVSEAPTAADSAWARDSGGVVVHWPATESTVDSSGAVSAGDVTVVAPFGRAAIIADKARVVARWADGAPAAVEHDVGSGCIRVVGIRPPTSGDLELRASYRRLVSRLTGACGAEARFAPADSARLSRLAGDRPAVAAAGIRATRAEDGRLAAAFLAVALLLALVETLLRRRTTP
ncbi:MAG TPA: BatA domain-containing protein [Gemmatimonadaceae bacterium]|nr:BatA domain-containing protein [Gemmatimonadaceae bacterium]